MSLVNFLVVEHASYNDGKPSVYLQGCGLEGDVMYEVLVATCPNLHTADKVGVALTGLYKLPSSSLTTLY